MRYIQKNSDGVSEVVSMIIIVALLLVLVMVVYALFFGSISGYLKPTYRVAATAGTANVPLGTSDSTQILYARPAAGDKYYLSGQSNIPSGYPVASFILYDPSGHAYNVQTLSYSSSANQYGTPLFIYQDQNFNMYATDSQQQVLNRSATIRSFANGLWTIKMIDNTANVPLTQMTVNIGGSGSSINPLAGSTTWANGSWNLVNSSGYQIPFTNYGVTPLPGPGGPNAFYFNGSSYVSGQDNAGLDFTGDMSLSLWIDPTTANSALSSSGSNWGNLVGKGSINSAGQENDNYQLAQMGNQLYFEWGDTSTGQHYNIVTPTGSLTNSQWNYVAVTTTASGAPEIYINGVAQPYTLSNSNTPLYNVIGGCTNPPSCSSLPSGFSGVKLDNVNNGITIGKQNAAAPNEFYYTGGMSQVTFYNQAITQTSVANNYNNNLT
jgi:hypothetical protein